MKILSYLGFIALLLCTDIGIKSCVENTIEQGQERRFLGNKITVRKVYNKGMALNLMDSDPDKVKQLTTGMTLVLVFYTLLTLCKKGSMLRKLGLSLMTAGALGNVFDRYIRGYVIDYLAINSKHEKINRITFNLADLMIVEGGLYYFLSGLKGS